MSKLSQSFAKKSECSFHNKVIKSGLWVFYPSISIKEDLFNNARQSCWTSTLQNQCKHVNVEWVSSSDFRWWLMVEICQIFLQQLSRMLFPRMSRQAILIMFNSKGTLKFVCLACIKICVEWIKMLTCRNKENYTDELNSYLFLRNDSEVSFTLNRWRSWSTCTL